MTEHHVLMRAEILDLGTRFDIKLPEGDPEPPRYMVLTLRPCWRKPPVRYELVFMYRDESIAYYGVLVKEPGVV